MQQPAKSHTENWNMFLNEAKESSMCMTDENKTSCTIMTKVSPFAGDHKRSCNKREVTQQRNVTLQIQK